VITTDPTAGTQVEKGQKITLNVGGGTSVVEVSVPDVENLPLAVAKSRLTAAGLGLPIVTDSTCGAANGVVCSQLPVSGTMEPKGYSVQLFVSIVASSTTTTSPDHVVPTVTNLTTTAACSLIQSVGLQCAASSQYTSQYSSTVTLNNVIGTTPAAGIGAWSDRRYRAGSDVEAEHCGLQSECDARPQGQELGGLWFCNGPDPDGRDAGSIGNDR
jgi:beta-lactam-binding protein with PASTA domain